MIRYVTGPGDVVQIDLVRGDTESVSVQWKDGTTPVDLTGYTAELLDIDDAAISASVTIPTPSNGTVVVTFSAVQTAALTDKFYRLRVTSGSFKKTLIAGRLNVV